MRVFKVLDDKSIVKADSRLFWAPIFSTIPLIEIGVKIDVFGKTLRKSQIYRMKIIIVDSGMISKFW